MDAVAAVLLAFGAVGLVAAVLTVCSTRRRAGFQDVDGPSPAVIAALRLCERKGETRRELRCRVGDRAIMVRSDTLPGCVGMIVRVEAPSSTPTYDWLVSTEGSLFAFPSPGPNDHLADCDDICLRPIRPEDAARRMTAREAIVEAETARQTFELRVT